MRVIQSTTKAGDRVVALGTFDGVHLGHQELLKTAFKLADCIGIPLRVCTFNRHPLEILHPQQPPELLSTIPEKARLLYKAGVDEMELIPFNQQTADLEPEDFLERLRKTMRIRAIVAGWNYTFGRKGRGDAELLRHDGQKNGYEVMIVPPITLENGTAISSTLVRQKLREGYTEEAAGLLGRDYTITGTVVQGKHIGHKLGYPTANILPWKRKVLPGYGVYACVLETNESVLPAVTNIGIQPTLPSGDVTVETHVLNECPELYGKKVRIMIRKKLRDEIKFDSEESLRRHIQNDCEETLRLFDMA